MLYDELHWVEGKYQAFLRDGNLGGSTAQGGEASSRVWVILFFYALFTLSV